jgi:hypothetical protein
MSDPIPLHERAGQIAETDEIFKRAAGADSAGDTSGFGPRECWEEAVHMFTDVARRYRDLGLGLRARDAWAREAECHRKIAAEHERWAKECEELRDAIEVIWEGADD